MYIYIYIDNGFGHPSEPQQDQQALLASVFPANSTYFALEEVTHLSHLKLPRPLIDQQLRALALCCRLSIACKWLDDSNCFSTWSLLNPCCPHEKLPVITVVWRMESRMRGSLHSIMPEGSFILAAFICNQLLLNIGSFPGKAGKIILQPSRPHEKRKHRADWCWSDTLRRKASPSQLLFS